MGRTSIKVEGREVEITHPDRVLFPDAGITKRDLCEYYARVSAVMLPHVEGRIVSMQRLPDGVGGEQFFQKNVPDYFPSWIRTVEVAKKGGTLRQAVIDSGATLVYLANQACVTPHCWLSRSDRRDSPDRMIFDLDPSGGADFDDVRQAARLVRDLLHEVELEAFVMTTGSRGLHVVAALEPTREFDRVREMARGLAARLVERHPDLLTIEQRKAKRGDRVFLDYLRNAYAQTTAAPYSVRARPGAPVATPIDWSEVATAGPRSYHLRNLFRRLGQKDDPWRHIDGSAGSLGAAAAWLDSRP